jgi:hypothetical protein
MAGGDYTKTEDGEVPNHEHIQRSRLRFDFRKWLASKMASRSTATRSLLRYLALMVGRSRRS